MLAACDLAVAMSEIIEMVKAMLPMVRFFIFITTSLSAVPLFASDDVRWAQVRKLIKKIVMRPDLISRHLPVGENTEQEVRNVVDEPAAVVRERRGAFGVIPQKVRQQFSGHPFCSLGRIPARVFSSVCEDGNEMGMVQ